MRWTPSEVETRTSEDGRVRGCPRVVIDAKRALWIEIDICIVRVYPFVTALHNKGWIRRSSRLTRRRLRIPRRGRRLVKKSWGGEHNAWTCQTSPATPDNVNVPAFVDGRTCWSGCLAQCVATSTARSAATTRKRAPASLQTATRPSQLFYIPRLDPVRNASPQPRSFITLV